MTDFGYLSEEVKVSEKGRFSLPTKFHRAEAKDNTFIIFADTDDRELKITTKEIFEEYRDTLEEPASRRRLDPQEYLPDDLWRGTFSSSHRKFLGLKDEKAEVVKFYGDNWCICVQRLDTEATDDEIMLTRADKINASKAMMARYKKGGGQL